MTTITENVIIELRQLAKDANDSGGQGLNGEYDITLPERVTIKENDIISIQSVFIDDEGENEGKIVIEEAVEGYISFNMYFLDTNPSQYYATPSVPLTGFRNYSDTTLTNHPDGKKYFLSSLDDVQSSGNERLIDSMEFETASLMNDSQQRTVSLVFTLVNAQGQTTDHVLVLTIDDLTIHRKSSATDKKDKRVIYTINQPILDKAIDRKFTSNFSFPFLVNNITVEPIMITSKKVATRCFPMSDDEPDGLIANTLKYGSSRATESATAISICEERAYFSLDAGKYDPDDLARRITDQITSPFNRQVGGKAVTKGEIGRTGADGVFPAYNNFTETEVFQTSQNLFRRGLKYDGTSKNAAPLWLREDGAKWAQMTDQFATYNQWCGASNFGLTFNGADRFEFTNLHNSIYSSGTSGSAGVKVIRGVNVANDPTKNTFLANASSGLSISMLHPASLWVDKLGFSQNVAYQYPKYAPSNGITFTRPAAGGGTETVTPTVEIMDHLVEGVNFTGDLASTDALTYKSDVLSTGSSEAYDIVGSTTAGIVTAIVGTYPVVGDEISQGAKQLNGYYLIEVDGGFPSKMIGHDKANNKVQAVVGRFYSGTTYTQSTGGEGSIPYQHKGNAIQLSSLKCRITLPDGSLPTLGPDNTIFLKITRGK